VNQAKTSTMVLTRAPSTQQALAALGSKRASGRRFAVLALAVVLFGIGVGAFVSRPTVTPVALPAPVVEADLPKVAAVEPEVLAPLPVIDAGLAAAGPVTVPAAIAVKNNPVKKVALASPACTFDDRFRDYARQVVAELRQASGGGARFDKLEDDVGAALVERDCKRVNQALSGMRRVAGVREDE
jgi:hypothetical protein